MGENNILTTQDLTIPVEVAKGIFDQAFSESVIARLSKQRPMLFGESEAMTFTGLPKAQLVGEGKKKTNSKVDFGSFTVKPHKLQITVRMNEEFRWADTDHKLEAVKEVADSMAKSLGRALDDIVIHKINPATGEVDPTILVGLTDCDTVITFDDDIEPDYAIEKACRAVKANHYKVNGIALDEDFGFELASMRDENGRKIYGDLGLGDNITSFLGKNTAVGDTVSGEEDVNEDSNILAIAGDFNNGIRWGVQKEIKCKIIPYGDPDGTGVDLMEANQVALRAEIVYGVGIATTDAFALVKKAAE